MVTREDWIINRKEKLEAMILAHLSNAPEGRLAVGFRSVLNPTDDRPHTRRITPSVTLESFGQLINRIASAIALEDCVRFESARDVRDEEAVINDASEMVETAISAKANEKEGWAR